jgi:hypothetical protein
MRAPGRTRRHLWLAWLFFAVPALLPAPGSAQTVEVRIGPPPVYRFAAPPPVVVIPGTYAYVIPDVSVEIFFFSGYWYQQHKGHWFRARSYNGPWTFWPDNRVPRALVELPPGYRGTPPVHRRITQGELRRNWAKWQRSGYWDRDPEWRAGRSRPGEEGPGPGQFEGKPGPHRQDRDFGPGEGRGHGRR